MRSLAAIALLAAALSGCGLWRGAPLAPDCGALDAEAAAHVAPEESFDALARAGVVPRKPLWLMLQSSPPGAAAGTTAAALVGRIGADGRVVPGSVQTVFSKGDAAVVRHAEQVLSRMVFDLGDARVPVAGIPFATRFSSCPSRS